MLLTMSPPIKGNRATPLPVAVTPCTTCMYNGMNMTTPRNDMLMTNEASVEMRNALMRNRCSGKIASLVCTSTQRKMSSDAAATPNSHATGVEAHG